MRKLALLFCILALLPTAIAETQIFSSKVITDTDKVIDNGIFRFRYDETSNKVFVQTPSTGLIVNNGECKANNFFRVCINKANFSHKNITTYVYYYEVDATIYKLTGSLSSAIKSSLTTLLPGETAKLDMKIENPTEFDMTNILFNYPINNFSVLKVTGCTLEGNVISWKGSLQPKYDKACTATIKAENSGTYDLSGKLSYFNSFQAENKTTDALKIVVLPKQLKVIQALDKNVEIKKPFHINVSLQNKHSEEKTDVSIIIEIPSNFDILEHPSNLNREFNILKRRLTLEPSSYFNYSLYLEASSEGDGPIKEQFVYTIKNIDDVIENYTFINPIEPKPIIDFTSEYQELQLGQNFIVIVKLKNPSRFHELTGIKARLNAPYNKEIEQNLNKLMPNESYQIISNILNIPKNIDFANATANGTILLKLAVEYKLKDSVKLINKSLELKIKQELANATTTEKEDSKAAQEAKTELQPEAQSQAINKTESKIVFNKQSLIIGSSIFAIVIAVTFVILKIRNRKTIQK